ncbi:TRAP-type uncharacterized transport system, fused permease component [hydrothermal vent metagenome]|uniref:TRAP-type uncharacterized transport system, fused permease component n=1 Tax=hydrothermal vent metagenome TaxID=652676 RepID=A0A3B1CPR3_9ZZZZ
MTKEDFTIARETSGMAEQVIETETGARHPHGSALVFITAVCLSWSLFQLSVASFITLDAWRARVIHLAFAIVLAFLVFPARKHSKAKDYIPWHDWALAAISALCVLYIIFDFNGLNQRPGIPLPRDIAFGLLGMALVLEACRRCLGWALTGVACAFIIYSLLGPHLPDIIAHRGYSIRRIVDHQFLTTEGIFGVPLGVSAAFVFLFVLFGSMLDKAGAGQYFIEVSYSLLGRFRGGPAKAAILSSGLTGMVNGSSVANVVTTGTFTIPLMKKVGYPPEKAAAIEVAASTDGQLMPPIMGAAAFIIAEFLGITYFEVVRAAIIPALASYLTLFYISHLEALKLGLKGAAKEDVPKFFPTLLRGAHYLVPVAALIISLLILKQSPIASAFNAILILMGIMALQSPLKALAGGRQVLPALLEAFTGIYDGLINGSRNMVTIGIATATAGIIVGTVTLTGLGLRVVEIVEILSMGSLPLMLLITAFACLLLGMGLPTTATYIVMATLTAPIIVTLGANSGVVIPLIAVHLFVFYFGILADDTPPVGLCAYAASGIAGSDPVRTGIQSFTYDIRVALLPFMFIYNNEILLIGVTSYTHGIFIMVMTALGMYAFASATQGYAVLALSYAERIILLLVTWLLINPYFFNGFISLPSAYFYCLAGLAIYGAIVGRQLITLRKAPA